MIKSIKRLFCHHQYEFLETVHGDRIIHLGYARSIWKCSKCGRVHYSQYLDKA